LLLEQVKIMNVVSRLALALATVGSSIVVGCASPAESSDAEFAVSNLDTIVQVEKSTAQSLKQDVVAARSNMQQLRAHARRVSNGELAQVDDAVREIDAIVAQAKQLVREMRAKLELPQATSRPFARVPRPEYARVIDRLADIHDAYLEKLRDEVQVLAKRISAGEDVSAMERNAVFVHVQDVAQNLNFALRHINEWIAEADGAPLPRCEGTNLWGSFPSGGACSFFGCWSAGGGCNLFGCFEAGGSCTFNGCVREVDADKPLCRPR